MFEATESTAQREQTQRPPEGWTDAVSAALTSPGEQPAVTRHTKSQKRCPCHMLHEQG